MLPSGEPRRYLVINTPLSSNGASGGAASRPDAPDDSKFQELDYQEIDAIGSARRRISADREVQLCWLAFLWKMKSQGMRVRDLYEKLDTDLGDSVDYFEFSTGVRSFSWLYDVIPPEGVESIILSMFPDGTGTAINWDIFDRVLQAYPSRFFAGGTFAQWAGRQLTKERFVAKATNTKFKALQERSGNLAATVDELRLAQAEGEECSKALSASRAQVFTLVSLKEELQRKVGSLESSKHALEDRVAALDALVEQHALEHDKKSSELKGKEGTLANALEKYATAEEEIAALREKVRQLSSSVRRLEDSLGDARRSVDASDCEVERLQAEASRTAEGMAGVLKSKHALEMKVIQSEEATRSAVKEMYGQRVVASEGVPWWQRKIEALEAKAANELLAAQARGAEVRELKASLAEARAEQERARGESALSAEALKVTQDLLVRSQKEIKTVAHARDSAVAEANKLRWH